MSQKIKNQELLLGREKNMRGGFSGVMGDRNIERDYHKKIIHIDAKNFHRLSMSQYLPYKDIEYKINVEL